MELNEANTDNSQDIVIRNEQVISSKTFQNLNYLYLNVHRIIN